MKLFVVIAFVLSTVSSEKLYPLNPDVPGIVDEGGRITNGNKAKAGQFPYQVGLSLQISSNVAFWCGGSLIGNEWVLTAAHCTDRITSVGVYLGSTVRSSSEVIHAVLSKDIFPHPEWNPANLRNDIALIKIPSTPYSANIKPVKLPNKSESYSTYEGENVIVSGWGKTSDDAIDLATDLQWARMQVIPNSICETTFGSSMVAPSNICISTPKATSPCKGDAGGPLVLASSKVLIGLTSFASARGCEMGHPAGFTRIDSYLDWIKDVTGI
uniref:Putative serine proteases 1/2-like protein n=2 Tax=Haematobia irritans TaxID=7368 RepID=A0A1L8EC59_HAEIR